MTIVRDTPSVGELGGEPAEQRAVGERQQRGGSAVPGAGGREQHGGVDRRPAADGGRWRQVGPRAAARVSLNPLVKAVGA